MQVGVGVAVEELARRAAHVVALPGAAQRRAVDVAFRGVACPGSRYHGSEYVLVFVKLFIASCTPSL